MIFENEIMKIDKYLRTSKGKKEPRNLPWCGDKKPSYSPNTKYGFYIFDEKNYADYLKCRHSIIEEDYNALAIDTKEIYQLDFDDNTDKEIIEM